jgi:hypothetical protein
VVGAIMSIRPRYGWPVILILLVLFWTVVVLVAVNLVSANATEFGSSNGETLGFNPDVDRVYLQAPDNWNKVNGPAVVSFKLDPAKVNAGKYDTMLRSWFRSAPNVRVWYVYNHEPENDYTTTRTQTAYRQASRHIVRIERSTGPNKLVPTIILMSYTLKPGVDRQVSDFWPGGKYIDVLAFDGYNRNTKGYDSPGSIYGPAYKVAQKYGKPFAVGEWGSAVVHGNTQGRARWIKDVGAWLSARHSAFACYWHAKTSRGDFRLLDTPSRNALKGLMR